MSVPTFTPYIDPFSGQLNPVGVMQAGSCLSCLYWNQAEILLQITNGLTGGTGSIAALLAYNFQPTSLPPSWACIRNGSDLYLLICGTSNWQQVVQEVSSASGESYVSGTYVNSYLWQQASNIVLALREIVTDDPTQLRMHVCGHSMGAAVGHLIANQLVLNGWGYVDEMSFGEPRGVSAGLPANQQCLNWYRVCGDYDLICFIPPIKYRTWVLNLTFRGDSPKFSYSHYGNRYNLLAQGLFITTANQNPNQEFSNDMINNRNINSHLMGTYMQRMLAEQRSSNRGGVNDRVAQIVTGVINGPTQQTNVTLLPTDYLTSQNVTATYFAGVISDLDTAAIDTLQTIAGAVTAGAAFIQKNVPARPPAGLASNKTTPVGSQTGGGGYLPHKRKRISLNKDNSMANVVNPGVRMYFGYGTFGYGFEETYMYNGAASDEPTLQINAAKLAAVRCALLGNDVTLLRSVAFSRDITRGDVNVASYPGTANDATISSTDPAADPPWAGVQCNFYTGSSVGCRVLAGSPDGLTHFADGVISDPGWVSNFNAYKGLLVKSWGLWGLNPATPQQNITAIAPSAGGLPGYTYTCATHGLNTNDQVRIGGFLPKKDNLNQNVNLTGHVQAIDANTFCILGAPTAGAFKMTRLGYFVPAVFQINPITDVQQIRFRK